LRVDGAWIRAMPPGAKNTAAFFRLTNAGAVDVVLTGAESVAAKRAELHAHKHENGVMKMEHLASLVVKAHDVAAFAPGGLHVMLFEQQGLAPGDRRAVVLRCADGSTLVVDAVVAPQAPRAHGP
jgi:copper(I)-binding protein